MSNIIIYIILISTFILIFNIGFFPTTFLIIFGILLLKYKNIIAKNIKSPYLIFGSIVLFFIIYISIILWNIWPIDNTSLAQAGTFGDSFGLLTSLFSALAFGALLITLWQQQEDLNITRQEIKEQQFENILFKMLDIHSSIVQDLDIRSNRENRQLIATGRDCFFRLYKKGLKEVFDIYKNDPKLTSSEEILNKSYNDFWEDHRVDLAHYFRYLYNIFKTIHSSDINSQNKIKYSNIIRAQLSDYELLILFYNGLSKDGLKFQKYIEEYTLFDNLPISLLLDEKHKDLYKDKAYIKERH